MFPTANTEDITQVTSLSEKHSTDSDAQNSSENSQVSLQQNNRELTLNMLLKEMVFCVTLALTTYGALHNTSTKVSKHPQAYKFFGPESVVTDWYKGELSSAINKVNNVDVSFVMYYAPWDAESQYVRGEFEKTAMVLKDRVHFAAINCWNPGSECRLLHNKIPSWPILIVYTVNTKGIFYKGPKDTYSMLNFLELIMKPLKRVSSTQDLINLLSMCDAVAVGYTPLADTSKYYNIWYNVALKIREYDTVGEICFAAVTSEDLSADLGVDIVPNARLMLWNDTKEYISEDANIQVWNESSLMNWVLENFAQPVARIIPMWKKSFSFGRYVDGNPILILFTPMNPLYEQQPSYALLREVAMEYYNCNNRNYSGSWTTELIKLQHIQRILYQQKNFTKFCEEYKFKRRLTKSNSYHRKDIQSHNYKYPWTNTTQNPQRGNAFSFLGKRGLDITKAANSGDDHHLFSSLGMLHECSPSMMSTADKSFYGTHEQCQSNEDIFNCDEEIDENLERVPTSMLPDEDDPLSPENLVQDNVKHFCRLMKFANGHSPPLYFSMDPEEERNVTRIEGMSCANNFSLYILAVDSIRNHHFAESLGVNITNKKDMTSAVILDSKVHIPSKVFIQYLIRTILLLNKGLSYQVIKFFKKPAQVTVVAICGGACGAVTSRAVAEGVRLLRACGLAARAARLDALRHDLPYHYTVDKYPTIFVFSADSNRVEAESAVYPATQRVCAGGVAALALRTRPAPIHARLALALCATVATNIEKNKCLKEIREHITALIGRNLKYWRRTVNELLKGALFKRLQHLHQVSLKINLIHITDLSENSIKQTSLVDSLVALSKNWEIDETILRRNVAHSALNS
ncbi:uncharacterized protein LOC114240723 [Bombyx mandarina]|uniref:Uncharacterized protein LOC114240723 n=1 Tax=Bombyx mandarina TaxID=7092 RepID=A0A6J2JCL1_BOMMA|nr:uncharacterized protein LOC114240723 [Bombyx mandarina]